MHEMGVAMEICRLAEARLDAVGMRQLVEVGLVVGDAAGVEADNLTFCLDVLLAQPPFAGARAVVARVPGDALRLDYLEIDDER